VLTYDNCTPLVAARVDAALRLLAVVPANRSVLRAQLGATSARADWHRAESPLFIVYSDGKEDELKQFVSELHEYDALLRLLTGTTTPDSASKICVMPTLRPSRPGRPGLSGLATEVEAAAFELVAMVIVAVASPTKTSPQSQRPSPTGCALNHPLPPPQKKLPWLKRSRHLWPTKWQLPPTRYSARPRLPQPLPRV
jgi:hypothetical protein